MCVCMNQNYKTTIVLFSLFILIHSFTKSVLFGPLNTDPLPYIFISFSPCLPIRPRITTYILFNAIGHFVSALSWQWWYMPSTYRENIISLLKCFQYMCSLMRNQCVCFFFFFLIFSFNDGWRTDFDLFVILTSKFVIPMVVSLLIVLLQSCSLWSQLLIFSYLKSHIC